MGDPDIDRLIVLRRQRKGAITRHIGNLTRLVAEEDVELVTSKLKKMKETFDSLESAHNDIVATLVNQADFDDHEKWFLEIESAYIDAVRGARAWLKSQQSLSSSEKTKPDSAPAAVVTKSDDSAAMCDLINLMNIPTVEIDMYDGNPMDYQAFITIFDELIDSKLGDPQLKLTRLLQYTTGAAKSAIKNCVGGESGYKQARDILRNRFGNKHIITQTIISQLKTGERVTKPHELQQLADDLDMAGAVLEKLGKHSEVDTQQMIVDILEPCQLHVKNRWCRKALDHKRDCGNYQGFSDFTSFMRSFASDASDPIYGSESTTGKGTRSVSYHTVARESDIKKSSTSYPVKSQGLKSSDVPCILCQENHVLFVCETFKSMSPKERQDLAVKHRLCFNCLKPGHGCSDCKRQSTCSVQGCNRKHTKFLHPVEQPDGVSTTNAPNTYAVTIGEDEIVDSYLSVGANVYLPIVPMLVEGKYEVYALLDNASTNTFMTQRLMMQLGMDGHDTSFQMNTLAGSTQIKSRLVDSVNISSLEGDEELCLRNVLTREVIPARYPVQQIDLEKYPHLSDLSLFPIGGDVCVELLIGQDHGQALMPLEVRSSSDSTQPYATRTMFGWSLNGPMDSSISQPVSVSFVDLDRLDRQVQNLWELEVHDIDDQEYLSVQDRQVLDLWNCEIRHVEGHYELPIPWRDGCPAFPDNKFASSQRLNSLLKKLNRNGMTSKYQENIDKLFSDGYAEVVPSGEIPVPGSTWFLPHHGVTSDAKPGKLRVVFDCAAQQAGVSLNNQCYQGPDQNNKLLHVLLRFRQFPFAIMADVEYMYHQVRVPAYDRNCLRFLWRVNGLNVEYRMTSHLFGGVWCSSSSTFALRQTVIDCPTSQLVEDTVRKSFYVDDLLKSVKTRDEAVEVIHGTKLAVKVGGFNLTKFVVNDSHLLDSIAEHDRAQEVKEIHPEMLSKALGIKWNVTDDTFYYISKCPDSHGEVTRRIMLSQVSSMYDPLGLISPVVMQGKALFQEATRLKLGWDVPVPEDLSFQWSTWLLSLSELSSLSFSRCVIPDAFVDGAMELHHFCDASMRGYGACTYIRIVNCHGDVHVALVASKARLAPLRQLSIPRLELLAATVAVKLDSVVSRELEVPLLSSTYWSDSQIVLAYITNETRRFKTFVANRVQTSGVIVCLLNGNISKVTVIQQMSCLGVAILETSQHPGTVDQSF